MNFFLSYLQYMQEKYKERSDQSAATEEVKEEPDKEATGNWSFYHYRQHASFSLLNHEKMKIVKSIAIALIMLTAWTACKKDKDDNKTFSVEGVWIGTLTQVGKSGTGYLRFDLKSNGKLERVKDNGEVVALGTWQMVGDSLKAVYTFTGSATVVNMKGKLNQGTKQFSGVWANSSEQGGWTADKK